MHILRAHLLQDLGRAGLMLLIACPDPKKKTATLEMILNLLSIIVTDEGGEQCADAGTQCPADRQRRDSRRQGSAGCDKRKAANCCRDVHENANDGAFGIADAFLRDKGRRGHRGFVFQVADRAILAFRWRVR